MKTSEFIDILFVTHNVEKWLKTKICSLLWRIWKEIGQNNFWPSGPGIRTPDFQGYEITSATSVICSPFWNSFEFILKWRSVCSTSSFQSHFIQNQQSALLNPKIWGSYRVPHGKVDILNWLWQIEIGKLDFFWRYLYIPEVREFEFHQPVFKKVT